MTALKSPVSSLGPPLASAVDFYRRTLYWLGAGAMATMMMVVIVQIFCRYVLGFSLVWSEELSRAILVWITFLFAGRALDAGEIIAVEVLVNRLPRWWRLAAVLLGSGVALWVVIQIAIYGYRYAIFNSGQVTAALQISQFWIYVAIPVGFGLFAIHLTVRTFARVLIMVRNMPDQNAADSESNQ